MKKLYRMVMIMFCLLFAGCGAAGERQTDTASSEVTSQDEEDRTDAEDAHKSWDSGRPLPKAILNGGLSYRARLAKV